MRRHFLTIQLFVFDARIQLRIEQIDDGVGNDKYHSDYQGGISRVQAPFHSERISSDLANMSCKKSASTKGGIPMPMTTKARAQVIQPIASLDRRDTMPSPTPKKTMTMPESIASFSVAGKRSFKSSLTARRVKSDFPRSPRSRPEM